jgi:hypothetical protein
MRRISSQHHPALPMAQSRRCRTIVPGSGDANRMICSSLIAQAFDVMRYPILPRITRIASQTAAAEVAERRHSSLYAPRDFDISPYLMVGSLREKSAPGESSWEAAVELINLAFMSSCRNYAAFVQASMAVLEACNAANLERPGRWHRAPDACVRSADQQNTVLASPNC